MAEAAAPRSRRRRVQFTVRTLFAAMVLVSLFGAAGHLPGMAKEIAIVFLAWLTFAGLYWTFGGIGPLVALPVASAVACTLLIVTIPLSERGEGIWEAVPIACDLGIGWGIVFSIIVIFSRVLRLVIRWFAGRFGSGSRGRSVNRHDATPAWSALRYAGYILLTMVLIDVVLFLPTAVLPITGVLFSIRATLYLPLMIGLLGRGYHPLVFAAAVFAFPLYAGVGWIVGFIVARITRRQILADVAIAEGPAKETCERGPMAEVSTPP